MSYRCIKADVNESESLAAVSADAERVYWRMLSISDPWGRLHGRPAKVKAACCALLPMSIGDVDAAIRELETVGRILRYEVAEVVFAQIVDFDLHQPKEFTRKRSPSKFPDPPKTPPFAGIPEVSGNFRDVPGNLSREEGEEEVSTTLRSVLTPIGDEPLDEPTEEPALSGVPRGEPERVPATKPRDEIWDVLLAELGEPLTRSERGRRNKAVKELRDAGVTAGEVRLRIDEYQRRWPDIDLTDTGLVSNWSTLGRPAPGPKRTGRGLSAAELWARSNVTPLRKELPA